MTKRSSNARIWKLARTSMAVSRYRRPSFFQPLDLLGDQPAFGLAVPDAAHLYLFALVALGPQGLAQAALVDRDQAAGGGQDVAGGAIVALQPDDLGARKVALEAQDVVDLGPAPAIDRLVVVADHADVLPLLGQQPQPQVLRDVGVLVLVDQDVAEAVVVLGQHVGVLLEDGQVVQQQVAEVAGVQHQPRPGTSGRACLPAVAVGEVGALRRRQPVRRPAAVLPAGRSGR
jgi:hypothetical protein